MDFFSIVFNTKCRIIKLFQVYGGDEVKTRLWPLLQKNSLNNKNIEMTSGKQIYDFVHIEDVAEGLIECCNFNKKNRRFPQEWDLASGTSLSVKNFAKKIWKENKSTGKIFFSRIKKFDKGNYLSEKKKLWKIKSRIF